MSLEDILSITFQKIKSVSRSDKSLYRKIKKILEESVKIEKQNSKLNNKFQEQLKGTKKISNPTKSGKINNTLLDIIRLLEKYKDLTIQDQKDILNNLNKVDDLTSTMILDDINDFLNLQKEFRTMMELQKIYLDNI